MNGAEVISDDLCLLTQLPASVIWHTWRAMDAEHFLNTDNPG